VNDGVVDDEGDDDDLEGRFAPLLPDAPADAELPYAGLSPDLILDAVDSVGLRTSAHLLALGSYENRVYQVGIEDALPVVVKFYRPGRWTDEEILEEHAFTRELAALELPVLAPDVHAGQTLFNHAGFRFAVYRRQGGHAPALDDLDCLGVLGRTVGRMHAIGRAGAFAHRPTLDVTTFGDDSRSFLLAHARTGGFGLQGDLAEDYGVLTEVLLARLHATFGLIDYAPLRLHGDLHVGNILWRDEIPHLVDFDDARTGPAIQDLWMLLSGPRGMRMHQVMEIVEGYSDFCDFDARELALVEPLRTLRLMHHAAWLARRWRDPAFPRAFPWFGTENYWREHVRMLQEQLLALDEPSLTLHP
jgi:Ser/Thr protein kinase RdoA (MazF antagonist)